MNNRLVKKRISIAVFTLLIALFTALFAVSCGGGGDSSSSSDGGTVVTPTIDNGAMVTDAHLPVYKAYSSLPSYNLESLRARRDTLVSAINGDGKNKGYKALFAETSIDSGKVVKESVISYEIDPGNVKFDELVSKVNNYIGEAKSTVTDDDLLIAAKLLYEDHDLNGLYGVYQTSYRFYSNYVFKPKDYTVESNGGYLSEDPDGLAGYKAKDIIASAKKVLAKNLKIEGSDGEGRTDCTTDCNATYAEEYVKTFETGTLTKLVGESEKAKQKLEDAQKKFDFYYELLYKSGKYEDETVNPSELTAQQVVYGGDAEKAELAAETEYKFNRATMEAVYKYSAIGDSDLEYKLQQITKKYFEKATVEKGLKTYMEAANERVNKFGMTAQIEAADTEEERTEKTEAWLSELKATESYLTHFEKLKDYRLELSDGVTVIDLKTMTVQDGNAEPGEEYKGSDWNIVRDILNKYSGLTKSAIDAIRISNANKYGVSSDATVSHNVDVANKLADTVTSRYGEKKPRYNGYEIAKGFANSYIKDAALRTDDDATKSVAWFKNVATLSYTPAENEKIFVLDALNGIFPPDNPITGIFNKLFPQEKIPTVKVTAVGKDGNEIKCFDGNAKLKVVFGGIPATERNVNIILNDEKRLETATKALSATEKENLKDARSLRYYISFSVLVPAETAEIGQNNKNGNYLAMDEKDFERVKAANEGMRFKVELTFDGEKVQKASEFVAIGYEHSRIKFVSENQQEIKDGDEDIKMTFFLENVTTKMSVAILSQDSFKNVAFFVAIGVIALIVAVVVICAIVSHNRRKKYKVKYNALGGRFSGGQRVKFCKNYVYPDNPTRKGYRFMGWYANKKCTKKFVVSAKNKGKCVTAYAKWLPQAKYDKLNEAQEAITKRVNACSDYRGKANGTAGTGIHQAPIGYEEDPRITKLEIEKLSYEAKKAEEERKAEEVRLQTIREIEAAKNNDAAKENAEKEAEKAKLALQQALAEREALIALAKAEERNKVLEELADKGGAEGGVSEEKVNEIVDKKIKAYDEQRAKEIALEKSRLDGELAAKIAAEQARLAEEKAAAFDAGKAFDELKAEMLGYKPADELDFGLNESEVVALIKVTGDAVALEVDLDKAECEAKGFAVKDGEKLASAMLVEKDEDKALAKELIEEVLYEKGYMKGEKVAATESSAEERAAGFEFNVAKGRVAATAEEFLKLIRVNAKSYVLTEGEVNEKLLMKAFVANDKVYIYLNVTGDGFNAADETMQAEGLGTFMVVKTADDCKKALAAIALMMRENGLVRYPAGAGVTEEASGKGFAYTLKA